MVEKNMRKQTLIFLITLAGWTTSFAQDGSDIKYVPIDQLNNSYLGSFVHLDFYNRSFLTFQPDTVTLAVDGKPVRFVEHRTDDGFNNWFHRQYLESLNKHRGLSIRVVKSRLDKITSDSVFVTNFLKYYKGDKPIPEAREIENAFPKSAIREVLVSVESN